jgi:hypothetical protein
VKFAILSIPHTGTHFVLNLLGGHRENLLDWMNKVFEASGHEFYVSHTYLLPVFERVVDHGFNIVMPMRHPITTVRSWRNWEAKSDIEHKTELVKSKYVPRMYKNIITIDQLYDINYISVDSPNREQLLDDFNKKFGLNLSTEWKPLNSIGKHTEDIPEELEEETLKLIKENPKFFGRFY